MPDGYYLTPSDREVINKLLSKFGHLYENTITDDPEAPFTPSSDIYIAKCPDGIPARAGFVPGVAQCTIHRLVWFADGSRIENLDTAREDVYNIYPEDIGTDYIKVVKDKFGNWIGELPGQSTTSTTTTSTPIPCEGNCKWIWSAGAAEWQLDEDNCIISTTTSTSSTSSTSSTTTSTTTTNPTDCRCRYPDFCGADDGEVTFTLCQTGADPLPPAPCLTTTSSTSTTSTTSRDCDTTVDVSCNEGCTWKYFLHLGWRQVAGGCCPDCDCPAPDPGVCGDEDETECICTTTTVTPCPDCTGEEVYGWESVTNTWVKLRGFCSGFCDCNRPTCYTDPPSAPGIECEEQPMPCHCPPSSTTPDPCTSTTTTTTTTTCDGECRFIFGGGTWTLESSTCPPDCDCPSPAIAGVEGDQIAFTPCGTITTTTTTTTTTTPAPTTTTTVTTTTSVTTTTNCPCAPGGIEDTGCFNLYGRGYWQCIDDEFVLCDHNCPESSEPIPPGPAHIANCEAGGTLCFSVCTECSGACEWGCLPGENPGEYIWLFSFASPECEECVTPPTAPCSEDNAGDFTHTPCDTFYPTTTTPAP